MLSSNRAGISILLAHGAQPLDGFYNLVFLANKLFKQHNEPELYGKFSNVPLGCCLTSYLALTDHVPGELAVYSISLMLQKT